METQYKKIKCIFLKFNQNSIEALLHTSKLLLYHHYYI